MAVAGYNQGLGYNLYVSRTKLSPTTISIKLMFCNARQNTYRYCTGVPVPVQTRVRGRTVKEIASAGPCTLHRTRARMYRVGMLQELGVQGVQGVPVKRSHTEPLAG
jgi:hypothetical protein